MPLRPLRRCNFPQFPIYSLCSSQSRVPKILTQKRRRDLTGRAIVNKQKFLDTFAEFTQGVFNGLDWNNVFVAGGAVLGAAVSEDTGYRSSDIDIFLYGITDEAVANEKVRSPFPSTSRPFSPRPSICSLDLTWKLRTIYQTVVANTNGGNGDVVRTHRAITILNAYPYRHVQIILRLYKSPAEVLMGFDIDSCCIGYDGTDVWCMERFRRALTKRFNLVNISRRSLTYETRLLKYSKRGFAVAVPDLDKSRVDVGAMYFFSFFSFSTFMLYSYLDILILHFYSHFQRQQNAQRCARPLQTSSLWYYRKQRP